MLPTTNRIREIEGYPAPRLQPREVALLPERPKMPAGQQYGRDDFGTMVLFFLLLGLLVGGG